MDSQKFRSAVELRLERLATWVFIGPMAVVSNMVMLLLCLVYQLFYWLFNMLQLNTQVDGIAHRYLIITGCDHGFGHMAALHLHQLGFNVFAGCLTDAGRKQLEVKADRKRKNRLITFSLNVASDESVAEALQLVKNTLPPGKGIWALVNNAGISGPNIPDDWMALEDYKSTMEVNLFGAIRVTHAFKELVKKSSGRLVFMSSILGRTALNNSAPYNASKFALVGYCETLMLELLDFGVKVIQIVPGYHDTHIASSQRVVDVQNDRYAQLPAHLCLQYPREEFLAKRTQFLHAFLRQMQLLSPLEEVILTIEHSVVMERPKLLYWVGHDANWHFRWIKMLPIEAQLWHGRLARHRLQDGYGVYVEPNGCITNGKLNGYHKKPPVT